MRSILTIAIVFILLIPASGQGQWEIVNEGFVCTPRTVDFISNDTGWIAGEEGIFLTIDGSKNWLKLNDDFNFHVIDFCNELIGWATVDENSVMKTLDGGRNWFLQKSMNNTIKEIHAVTESIVYVIGDIILKTVDGGSSWENITPSDGSDFSSACFINENRGIVISNERIIHRTFDGGETWRRIKHDFSKIFNVKFTNGSTGYFLARIFNDTVNIFICKTTDFFSNWTVLSETELPIQSCHFFDNDVIVANCREYEWNTWGEVSNSTISMIKSYDGGSSWNYIDSFIPLTSAPNSNVSDMMYFTENSGYYFGGRTIGISGPLRYIMRSIDQGNNWKCITMNYSWNDVHFIDRDKGFIVGGFIHWCHFHYGILYMTEDGGKTWNHIYYHDYIGFPSVLFVNESKGFITSCLAGGGLLSSADGGYSWIEDTTMGGVNDVFFLNDSIGFAVNVSGIFKTINGGVNWNKEYKIVNSIKSLFFIDEESGWGVGERGLIYKYNLNDGWVRLPRYLEDRLTTLPLRKVFIVDRNFGWISGGYTNEDGRRPIFMRTVDGGENWTIIPALEYLINDFYFENRNHGWAVGEDKEERSVILETFDSGLNWDVVKDTLSGGLNSLSFADGYGWAVGDNGLILKYSSPGTSNQKYPTIRTKDSFQNYPNPFCSRTLICYRLPATGNVELSVYDPSGRKVATLVNETQPAGRHEVEWNAGEMLPGIYFCALKTGQDRQVMKMIIID